MRCVPYHTVVQYDLVICLFYRISNLSIIISKSGALDRATAAGSMAARKVCFRVFGLLTGQRQGLTLVHVSAQRKHFVVRWVVTKTAQDECKPLASD